MEIIMEINVKAMRLAAKLTQTQVSELMHVKLRQVQRWEHGDTPVPEMVQEMYVLKVLPHVVV